jgi:hypothetical protein
MITTGNIRAIPNWTEATREDPELRLPLSGGTRPTKEQGAAASRRDRRDLIQRNFNWLGQWHDDGI